MMRKMIRAGWTVRIARPQRAVFDFVADPANAHVWSTDPSRFELTTEASNPPRELRFLARSTGVDARVQFQFALVDERSTDVTCRVEMRYKGALRLLEPLLAGIVRRGVETSRGPALKAALERT
jgi:hypothetical protein